MSKDLLLKIVVGFSIAITLYATYLRGKEDAANSKVGAIGKPMTEMTLMALTDFEISDRDIFVPAYRDSTRSALALDAALYKGSFAAANYLFTSPTGFYDLTLTTLKETKGESSYKILVDQKTWAFFQNDPTTEDYILQHHKVKDVYIAEGEVVQVQFNSNSNSKIPEGEGFAFSRGRWTSLRVVPAKRQ